MIFRNKRDSESWIRELTIDTMKENIYIAENDVIEISSGNFYKAVKTSTDIPLKNDLFAQLIPSELVGNVTTALKLKEPRKIELSGDVTGNVEFDGSKNVNLVANITDDSHSHSDSTITSLDAKKIKTGVIDEKRIPNLNANKISEGVFSEERIPVLDASKIGSGIIDIARLPAAALERLVEVEDDNARFKLTKTQIQLGDVVKVKTTLKMYKVINDDSLNNEKGYSVFLAGRAAEVPWSGVTDKPETFTPSKHGHSFSEIKLDNEHEFVSKTEKANWNSKAEKQHSHSFSELKLDDEHGFVSKAERNTWNSKAEKQHKHEKSEITDFPVALRNPFPLEIKVNGKELAVYDGENKKSINIVASDINTYAKSEVDKKLSEKANTSHGNHVPEVQTKSDKTFLRNDNTWAVVTPENIGAQPKGEYASLKHTHSAEEINQDAKHRFVTDDEKRLWGSKADGNHNHDSIYFKKYVDVIKNDTANNINLADGFYNVQDKLIEGYGDYFNLLSWGFYSKGTSGARAQLAVPYQFGNPTNSELFIRVSENDKWKTPWRKVWTDGNFDPKHNTFNSTQITQDAKHRFVTDDEKKVWSGKAEANHGNHVPKVQAKSDKTFLRNDNTWAVITPENIDAVNKNDQWRIKPKSIGNADTVTDLNNIREQGYYISSSSANKIANSPSGMTAFELTVTGISETPNSYKTQLLKDFNSNKYFVRTQTNWQEPMTWTAWTELGANKNPLDSLSFSINGNGELILEYNTEFAPNFSLKDGQLFYKFGNNGEMNLGKVAQDLTPLNNQINSIKGEISSSKAVIDYINSQLINFMETKKVIFDRTLGNGTITLTESYKNFDYIEILFSNDTDSMYCTSRFPVCDIDFARAHGKPYELQTWSACYWRVNIANDTTWTSAGENSIIKQIRGIKMPKFVARK